MSVATNVVHSDPEIMGGVPVFSGTRVPVQNLFDYIKSTEGIEEFLDDFSIVSQEQAVAALDLAQELVIQNAYSAELAKHCDLRRRGYRDGRDFQQTS
jgi:uncharacterized protein (DUF433 family)